jgi:uncharacterized protein (DUF4415 family)
MPKLKSETIMPTDSEDKISTQQAMEEDTLLTDAQLAEMKPISAFPELQALVKLGRPPKSNPKKSTTIRLDAEVLDFFKAKGKGWQTKINAVLQEYVDAHHAA